LQVTPAQATGRTGGNAGVQSSAIVAYFPRQRPNLGFSPVSALTPPKLVR
jgi:hypothetical protein